jgi:hypothetical protein
MIGRRSQKIIGSSDEVPKKQHSCYEATKLWPSGTARRETVEHSCCFPLFRGTSGAFPAEHGFTPNNPEYFNLTT